MYGFIKKWLPKPLAITVMVLWYLALLFLVFIFLTQAEGEFRYLNR